MVSVSVRSGYRVIVFFLLVSLFLLPTTSIAETKRMVRMRAAVSKIVAPYGNRVGVAFIDLRTGERFHIRGHRIYPAASVIKVPIMAALYDAVRRGRFSWRSTLALQHYHKQPGAGYLQYLTNGTPFSLWSLMENMILRSDNTASFMIVQTLGMKAINRFLASRGFQSTIVRDPTIVREVNERLMNVTTPLEMASCMARIAKGQMVSPTASHQMIKLMQRQRYRWGVQRGLPLWARGAVVANKTGDLWSVKNDAAIVWWGGRSYVLCVFTAGFYSRKGGAPVIRKVSKAVFQNL